MSTVTAAAYVVQPGDTVWSIAKRTGKPAGQIAQHNHLADPNRIYAGQRLNVEPAAASGGAGLAAAPEPAGSTYTVRQGDTLWSISRRTGVPVDQLVRANHLRDPNRLHPGQHLQVPHAAGAAAQPAAAPAAATAHGPPPVQGAAARRIVLLAARERGVDTNFVLAVSLWESGYNQGVVSSAGAIGLMQILPATADWAGPTLLGRRVDLNNPNDNARLGAALLGRYLDDFGDDPKLALAAYYQGAAATREHGIYPSSRRYVDGIWALRNLLQAST